MAKAVIHQFKTIEVDVENSHHATLTFGHVQGLSEPIRQESAIGQSRKFVGQCLVLQFFLGLLLGGIMQGELGEHLVELDSELRGVVVSPNRDLPREILPQCDFLHGTGQVANSSPFLICLEQCRRLIPHPSAKRRYPAEAGQNRCEENAEDDKRVFERPPRCRLEQFHILRRPKHEVETNRLLSQDQVEFAGAYLNRTDPCKTQNAASGELRQCLGFIERIQLRVQSEQARLHNQALAGRRVHNTQQTTVHGHQSGIKLPLGTRFRSDPGS